ncbi:copper-binding protein [Aminobacter sp. P9b]|uniref:copper-binding protein n=1 Tax=Aminobacter sp. P9b TaxID=3133697 RepID=UPI0032467201
MKRLLAVALVAFATNGAFAQTVPVNGTITKIDGTQNKITLKHGPITNLDMDAMTMVFALADPAVIKEIKVGDSVKFEADRVNGRLTVTKIEKAK